MSRTNFIFLLIAMALGAAAPVPAAPSWQGAAELATWNDPQFRKRFLDSYAAETEIEPRVTTTERDQLEKVLDLMAAGKMDEAANLLEKRQGEAASAVLDFTLGNVRVQQEQLDQAVAAYRTAVEKYPKFRRAWQNLGWIHFRQGEFEKARPALTRVIELGGGGALTYGMLGFCYAGAEDHVAAETAYRMAVLLDPDTLDWKMGLARSFFKQKRFADAAALCEVLIADRPDLADLWLLQANAYVGLDQPLKAAENLELVDRLGQSTADGLNLLGDVYTNEELFDLAAGSYLRAMEKDPQGGAGRAIRAARDLAARGASAGALELVERIEALQGERLELGERKELLRVRARLAVAEGAGAAEARVLEEIVALDPLDGEALLLLGQHSSRAGDLEKAAFYYERAAGLEAFEADAKVRHAQLLVGQGRYQEALPLLRRAQQVKARANVQEYLEQVERVAKARS